MVIKTITQKTPMIGLRPGTLIIHKCYSGIVISLIISVYPFACSKRIFCSESVNSNIDLWSGHTEVSRRSEQNNSHYNTVNFSYSRSWCGSEIFSRSFYHHLSAAFWVIPVASKLMFYKLVSKDLVRGYPELVTVHIPGKTRNYWECQRNTNSSNHAVSRMHNM